MKDTYSPLQSKVETLKIYYTISEASNILGIKSHVLRFWEKEFNLRIVKRNSRRYYTQETLEKIKHIRDLLYNKGYTHSGARQYLAEQKVIGEETDNDFNKIEFIKSTIRSLEEILKELRINN